MELGHGWQKARRRRMRQLHINIVAKIWFRNKTLLRLKKWYLRRKVSASSRLYRPLGDKMIRLLQVHPGYALNTVNCDFLYVDLHSAEDYVALSYTWGQQAPQVPILVNGTMMMVSENLYLALLHLRKRGCTTLWIDAICINQSDLQERASQVRRMKDIYHQASNVIIWLGDGNSLSAQGFDVLHGMLEHLDWQNKLPKWIADPDRIAQDPQVCKAIAEILCRPWFRRTWVIQEVLAARQAFVLCGNDLLSMDVFLNIIHSMHLTGALGMILSYYTSKHELPNGSGKVIIKQLEFLILAKFERIEFMKDCGFELNLLNLLSATRWAESSDARDKVYGLISLAKDAGSLGYRNRNSEWEAFGVDYNLSKRKVYIGATKAILWTTKSLDVLRFAEKWTKKSNSLPSWVPDWENGEAHDVRDHLPLVSNHSTQKSWRTCRKASDTAITNYRIHEEITWYCRPSFTLGSNDTLVLTGIQYDTITAASKHMSSSLEAISSMDQTPMSHTAQSKVLDLMGHHFQLLHEWIDDCIQKATRCSPYPTGDSVGDALWRTLEGDSARSKPVPSLPCDELRNICRKIQSILASAREQLIFNNTKAPNALLEVVLGVAFSRFEELSSRLQNLRRASMTKRFVTTQKKYMGLAPLKARVGDLVCVMYGSETPLILRRSGKGRFKFIGYGSLHGFDFDSAIAESSSRKGKDWSKRGICFSTLDANQRKVYTTLKPTRQFRIA